MKMLVRRLPIKWLAVDYPWRTNCIKRIECLLRFDSIVQYIILHGIPLIHTLDKMIKPLSAEGLKIRIN